MDISNDRWVRHVFVIVCHKSNASSTTFGRQRFESITKSTLAEFSHIGAIKFEHGVQRTVNILLLWQMRSGVTEPHIVSGSGRRFNIINLHILNANKNGLNSPQIMPLFVVDVMSNIPGLPGIFVAGIFSASLSTVSAAVNSLAAVKLEDYIKVKSNQLIHKSDLLAMNDPIFYLKQTL